MGKTNKSTAAKGYGLDTILAAIQNSYGIVSRVAERLECDWMTARKYIDMHNEAREAFACETERVLDLAETKVIKAINLDDVSTAKWLLSTKGKARGYNERTELTGKDGGPLNVSFDVDKLSTAEAAALLDLMEKAKGE